jgi:hypothetical protein
LEIVELAQGMELFLCVKEAIEKTQLAQPQQANNGGSVRLL